MESTSAIAASVKLRDCSIQNRGNAAAPFTSAAMPNKRRRPIGSEQAAAKGVVKISTTAAAVTEAKTKVRGSYTIVVR